MKKLYILVLALVISVPSFAHAQYSPDPVTNQTITMLLEQVKSLQAQLEKILEQENINTYVKEKIQEEKYKKYATEQREQEQRKLWEALPRCSRVEEGFCRQGDFDPNSTCSYEKSKWKKELVGKCA